MQPKVCIRRAAVHPALRMTQSHAQHLAHVTTFVASPHGPFPGRNYHGNTCPDPVGSRKLGQDSTPSLSEPRPRRNACWFQECLQDTVCGVFAHIGQDLYGICEDYLMSKRIQKEQIKLDK